MTSDSKPYRSKNLDQIRSRIDTLDNAIHDMLMERAELVLKIGEEKRKNNIQIVQPSREARMIRRLLARHSGVLPQMAVVRIWRELVGAVSLLQTGLKVAVVQDNQKRLAHNELWDLAKDYFGSCLPFQRSFSSLSALAAVRDGSVNFAVLPWPEDGEDHPWWPSLMNEEGELTLRIIICLPHGQDPDSTDPIALRGVVVSATGFDESGDDCSFLIIECDSAISRAKIIDKATKAGLPPKMLATQRAQDHQEPSYHFMEVEGYIEDGHEKTQNLLKTLDTNPSMPVRILCAGGYPVPPLYAKTIKAQE